MRGYIKFLLGKVSGFLKNPPQWLWIVLTAFSGPLLAWGFFGYLCSNFKFTAEFPFPWLLFPGVAAAPSVLLLWVWRDRHKRHELDTSDRRTRNDQFINAAKLLDSKEPLTQVAGVYDLARFIPPDKEADPQLGDLVVQLLEKAIRHWAPLPQNKSEKPAGDRSINFSRVQAAIEVLGRRFAGVDEHGIRKHRLDLSHTDLRGIRLSSIAETSWFALFDWNKPERANFTNTDFSGANLEGADARRVDFLKSSFENAELRKSNFSETDLRRCSFWRAKTNNASFSSSFYQFAFIIPLGFGDSNEEQVDTTFDSSCFAGSIQMEAKRYHRCSFSNSLFSSQGKSAPCSFGNSSFEHCYFHSTSFTQVHFRNIIFCDNVLESSAWVGCSFRNVSFEASKLTLEEELSLASSRVDFVSSDHLIEGRLEPFSADFRCSTFDGPGQDFTSNKMLGLDISWCDFSYADLRGLDLSRVTDWRTAGHQARFSNALYDPDTWPTQFPPDFSDPETLGMIACESWVKPPKDWKEKRDDLLAELTKGLNGEIERRRPRGKT